MDTFRTFKPLPTSPDASANPDWPLFVEAIHGLVHSSCCGAGSGAARMAAKPGTPHPLMQIGRDAWLARVAPRAPLVKGHELFVLPAVILAEPDAPPSPPCDVLIADRRIVRISRAGTESYGDAPVLESLRGLTVAPALVDLHTHLPPDNILKLTPLFLLLHLRHGIVRVRDAGDPDGTGTPAALALLHSGALPGPALHYAYAFVGDGPARWGNTLRMARVEDAQGIVKQLRSAGASWIKAYENLDAPRIAALVDAAGRAGMQVLGHVPTALKLEDARLPDAQHGFGVPEPSTLRRDHVLNRAIDWASVTPQRIEQVVGGCLRHGLAMTPTLSTSRNLLRLERWQESRTAADLHWLPRLYPEIIWHPQHGLPAYRDIAADDFQRAHDAQQRKEALVMAAASAGVRLHLGTDTQQPFVVPGAAMHEELAAFERCGVARATAWRWASRDAARLLAPTLEFGLREGATADLIIARSSPMASKWSAEDIAATIAGGRCLMREDLDAAIEHQLHRFDGRLTDHLTRWLARFALNNAARHFTG